MIRFIAVISVGECSDWLTSGLCYLISLIFAYITSKWKKTKVDLTEILGRVITLVLFVRLLEE